jgi:hypothetical protein
MMDVMEITFWTNPGWWGASTKARTRLKCPKCGFRNVRVLFNVPGEPRRSKPRRSAARAVK